MKKRSGPLSDIRILDLGRVIAAPYASQMLADYGADGRSVPDRGDGKQFAACCGLLGCPELPKDERFNGVMKRYDNRDALYALLEPLLAKWRVKDLVDALEKAQVPCSPVNDYRQLFDDPHTAARGMSVHLEHPLSQRCNVIASPMKLSRAPAQYERPPLLGEHSDTVLGELLSMDTVEIARLRAEGVV